MTYCKHPNWPGGYGASYQKTLQQTSHRVHQRHRRVRAPSPGLQRWLRSTRQAARRSPRLGVPRTRLEGDTGGPCASPPCLRRVSHWRQRRRTYPPTLHVRDTNPVLLVAQHHGRVLVRHWENASRMGMGCIRHRTKCQRRSCVSSCNARLPLSLSILTGLGECLTLETRQYVAPHDQRHGVGGPQVAQDGPQRRPRTVRTMLAVFQLKKRGAERVVEVCGAGRTTVFACNASGKTGRASCRRCSRGGAAEE